MKKINRQDGKYSRPVVEAIVRLLFSTPPGAVFMLCNLGGSMELSMANVPHSCWCVSTKLTHKQSANVEKDRWSLIWTFLFNGDPSELTLKLLQSGRHDRRHRTEVNNARHIQQQQSN